MKDRIKQIRKTYKLTQVEFGERIGVKGNTITNYETGLRNPSNAVILSICREFNVNKNWLQNGEGEMYKKAPSDALKQLADEYNLSLASCIVIEKFVNLKPEKRNELIEFFLEVSKAILEGSLNNSSTENCEDSLL